MKASTSLLVSLPFTLSLLLLPPTRRWASIALVALNYHKFLCTLKCLHLGRITLFGGLLLSCQNSAQITSPLWKFPKLSESKSNLTHSFALCFLSPFFKSPLGCLNSHSTNMRVQEIMSLFLSLSLTSSHLPKGWWEIISGIVGCPAPTLLRILQGPGIFTRKGPVYTQTVWHNCQHPSWPLSGWVSLLRRKEPGLGAVESPFPSGPLPHQRNRRPVTLLPYCFCIYSFLLT